MDPESAANISGVPFMELKARLALPSQIKTFAHSIFPLLQATIKGVYLAPSILSMCLDGSLIEFNSVVRYSRNSLKLNLAARCRRDTSFLVESLVQHLVMDSSVINTNLSLLIIDISLFKSLSVFIMVLKSLQLCSEID